jgi:hypothetical protein
VKSSKSVWTQSKLRERVVGYGAINGQHNVDLIPEPIADLCEVLDRLLEKKVNAFLQDRGLA